MTDSIITEAAVEAAKKAYASAWRPIQNDHWHTKGLCAALSAALPHITDPRLAAAQARIAELHERLEDNHVFQDDGTGKLVRVDVEPGSIPDGIYCRDETIKIQDENLRKTQARIAELEEALRDLRRARDVLERKALSHPARGTVRADEKERRETRSNSEAAE